MNIEGVTNKKLNINSNRQQLIMLPNNIVVRANSVYVFKYFVGLSHIFTQKDNKGDVAAEKNGLG